MTTEERIDGAPSGVAALADGNRPKSRADRERLEAVLRSLDPLKYPRLRRQMRQIIAQVKRKLGESGR